MIKVLEKELENSQVNAAYKLFSLILHCNYKTQQLNSICFILSRLLTLKRSSRLFHWTQQQGKIVSLELGIISLFIWSMLSIQLKNTQNTKCSTENGNEIMFFSQNVYFSTLFLVKLFNGTLFTVIVKYSKKINLCVEPISSCAFGVDTNCQENIENPVLENGRKIFSVFTCNNWIMSSFVNLFVHVPAILKVT